MLAEHFRTIASYNAWANGQVYDAANALPEAEYRKRRPAGFFGSIHATLNHLLVVDRLWSGRIEGQGPGDITGLDQILYDDLSALRTAREDEDRRIVGLVDALDEAALAGTRDFKDTRGNPIRCRSGKCWRPCSTIRPTTAARPTPCSWKRVSPCRRSICRCICARPSEPGSRSGRDADQQVVEAVQDLVNPIELCLEGGPIEARVELLERGVDVA